MTRKAQTAIIILSAALVVLAGLYGLLLDRIKDNEALTDCRSEWAAADRIADANLDVVDAQGTDLFLSAVVLGETEPLAAEFRETERFLNRAIRQRVHVSQEQGDLTALCDPNRPGGAVIAPVVDPLDPPSTSLPRGDTP